jgi:hypothetical protein
MMMRREKFGYRDAIADFIQSGFARVVSGRRNKQNNGKKMTLSIKHELRIRNF